MASPEARGGPNWNGVSHSSCFEMLSRSSRSEGNGADLVVRFGILLFEAPRSGGGGDRRERPGLLGAAGGRGRLRVAQFHTKLGELLPVALLDALELGNLVLLQMMERFDGIVPVSDERRRAARQ